MGWYDSFKTGALDYLTKGKSTQTKKRASSFWADEWSQYEYSAPTYWNGNGFVQKDLTKVETDTVSMLKLNAHRRAISNFVNILTNKNIPVKFARKGDSYTDGKSVVLSAEIKPEKFDVAVGLALHEASHIELTDFDLLPSYKVPAYLMEKYFKGIGVDYASADYVTIEVANNTLFDLIKSLTNFVEDRRIDQYIYDTCPGYRDYYRALYDEYFYDKIIDKGLQSDEYTEETLESYMFRIINITNQHSNLGKLKGLKKIYQLLELKNIKRLSSTKDSLSIAEQIVDVMLDNIVLVPQQPQSGGNGDGDNENGQPNGQQGDSDVNESGDDENNDMGGDNGNAPVMGDNSGEQKDMMSKSAKQTLDKRIKQQKDFVNNQIKKKGLTKKEDDTLDQIAKSGTDLESVGDTKLEEGGYISPTQCIVSKKMTEELMKDSSFPFANWSEYSNKFNGWNDKLLNEGIMLGTMLGKKLQIRSEERETVTPRQKNGRIDRRLVAALGFDYDSVFSTKEIDKFKKIMLHVTIDGSGSMSGKCWDDTLKLTIALCKASSMVSNLHIQVSIRGTWDSKAYVCIAYDSRMDKFEKVKRLFPALHASGTTPEGLCFQAIMKHFVESNKDMESYFLNICDGEPNFQDNNCRYNGREALLHTKKMVKQIKERGIKVMSYFVNDGYGYSTSSQDRFKTMYGNDSKFIDINAIVPITKTMNELFLKK
jgi:hypothetical protein